MKFAILLLGLILMTTPAFAWWGTAHLIIAKIAENELQRLDKDYYNHIKSKIEILTQFSREKDYTFIESATWADDNKAIAWGAFSDWHFVDTPVIHEGFEGDVKFDPENCTWAITQMKKTLTNTNPKFDNGLAVSFAWRYLIHLVGDIHQPLHASTLYSKDFPNGDRGGNSFTIQYNHDIKNLHALWDACCGQYGSHSSPLSSSEYQMIAQVAQNLTSTITRADVADRISILDEYQWAAESNELAEKYVYSDLQLNQRPSDEYLARGQRVSNEQIVVAGYRLTDLILTRIKSMDYEYQHRQKVGAVGSLLRN